MRIFLFLFALCILVYVGFEYGRSKRLIRIGTELAENAVPFTQSVEQPEFKILVIGDSSAVGTGADKSQDSVAGQLAADFPTANLENLGVNGSKTHELIPRLKSLPSEANFDLILIQTGGNDIVRFTNLEFLEQSINEVLQLAKEKSSKVILITAGNVGTSKLLPSFSRPFYRWRTLQVRNIFMDAAQEYGVNYIDLYRKPSKDPFAQKPNKHYADDYFHPSSEGYKDWYNILKKNSSLK